MGEGGGREREEGVCVAREGEREGIRKRVGGGGGGGGVEC